jgi:hypothetical protein
MRPSFALRSAASAALAVSCATSPIAGSRPDDSCGGDPRPPSRATLTVLLREPSGRVPLHAAVRADPCCRKEPRECGSTPSDAEGRVVLEVCPVGRSRDVIVSVETNPRFYTYAPPRSVRICSRLEEVTILLEPHPAPPGQPPGW